MQHATVFAVVARNAGAPADPAALTAISEAVRRYGLQRGRRMRKRAIRNGDPPDMASYRAYCEWFAEEGSFATEIVEDSPVLITRTTRCPWMDAWKKTGLVSEGHIYCSFVDDNLVKGFNEDLLLNVGPVLSDGKSGYCEFKWNGLDMRNESSNQTSARRERLMHETVKSWDYHIGHLLRQLNDTLIELMPNGRDIMMASVRELAEVYGIDVREIFDRTAEVDYEMI